MMFVGEESLTILTIINGSFSTDVLLMMAPQRPCWRRWRQAGPCSTKV